MNEKVYSTENGNIYYWLNEVSSDITLVFLPGLTADHRLFEKQLAYFENKYRCFVWDAPGHNKSYPFDLNIVLADKARWLEEILLKEQIEKPVIIGQSMGGYVGQMYSQLYPERLAGFMSIDSAPLQRKLTTAIEIWLLKYMEPVYYYYPWKWLLKSGTNGVAVSEYGRKLMLEMMMVYDGDKKRYAKLSGSGMKMLALAMEADLPYEIKCPVILVCGKKDMAGSCKAYSKKWVKNTGFRLEWIDKAGHNSNTDQPEIINGLIEELIREVK